MALPQSALNELLEMIQRGGGEDTLRDAMTLVLQELSGQSRGLSGISG